MTTGDQVASSREEQQAIDYADTGIELVQHIFERTPSKYGFPGFDDVANKNLVVANLSRKADEPMSIIRKADNIITYKRFAKEREVLVGWTGSEEEYDEARYQELLLRNDLRVEHDEAQGVIRVFTPVVKKAWINRFQTLLNEDLAYIQTLTGVSAGTDAAVLKLMRSTFIQKDQSIEERTTPKSTFWGKKKE